MSAAICTECHAPKATPEDLRRSYLDEAGPELNPWELAICWAAMPEGNHANNRPPSHDHPGGPLSRAESVLLSNVKRVAQDAWSGVNRLGRITGAISGAQNIERRRTEALDALNKFINALKDRKRGADQ